MTTHPGLPVAGYTEQSAENVALANELKAAEEGYLRILDRLTQAKATIHGETIAAFDGRCISLAKTKMQDANMWAVRAIFQPSRISLPGDAPPPVS